MITIDRRMLPVMRTNSPIYAVLNAIAVDRFTSPQRQETHVVSS